MSGIAAGKDDGTSGTDMRVEPVAVGRTHRAKVKLAWRAGDGHLPERHLVHVIGTNNERPRIGHPENPVKHPVDHPCEVRTLGASRRCREVDIGNIDDIAISAVEVGDVRAVR